MLRQEGSANDETNPKFARFGDLRALMLEAKRKETGVKETMPSG
jgi:hypothetical protein